MKTCDVIIVGLGTVGSAVCMALAQRGVSVIGLDAFQPPHEMGSHHGQTRGIRRAYMEGTAYVPMVMRAWELWQKLERDTGKSLLIPTGNLTIGPPDSPALTGFVDGALAADIAYQYLTAAEVRKWWPQLNPPGTCAAGLEIEAGLIFPEPSITTFLSEAAKTGAKLHFGERVMRWEGRDDRVHVQTTRGAYEGGRLLLAAGACNKTLLGAMGKWLTPKRVPVFWVAPPNDWDFRLGAFPVNFWQLPADGDDGGSAYDEFYSLPVVGTGGVKVAPHNNLVDGDPDSTDRAVAAEEAEAIVSFLGNCIPALAKRGVRSDLCFYSQTPDGDFVLGPLPGHDNVFTAALAGHGFKFAPVLGEILADMIQGRTPVFDVRRFSPSRLF